MQSHDLHDLFIFGAISNEILRRVAATILDASGELFT